MKHVGLGLAAAAVTIGIGMGAYASAQNTNDQPRPFMGRRMGPGGPGGPMGGLALPLGRLGLSDAQQEQVRTVMQAHREELQPVGERAMEARQALQAAVTAESFDEGLIRVRAAELAVVEADLAVARARLHGQVFQILTPEQQAKVRELQSQPRQRARQRQGR